MCAGGEGGAGRSESEGRGGEGGVFSLGRKSTWDTLQACFCFDNFAFVSSKQMYSFPDH